MNIGQKIKRLRKERKMTQSQLADKLDKSLRTVQKYENGDIEVSIDIINALSKIFNVQYDYFLENQPDDTYISANDWTLKKYVNYNSELLNEILLNLLKKGELGDYFLVDDDLDIITEETKKYIISLVTILSSKNRKSLNNMTSLLDNKDQE